MRDLTAELAVEARAKLGKAREAAEAGKGRVSRAFLPLALVEPYLRALASPGHDPLHDIADISPLMRVSKLWWRAGGNGFDRRHTSEPERSQCHALSASCAPSDACALRARRGAAAAGPGAAQTPPETIDDPSVTAPPEAPETLAAHIRWRVENPFRFFTDPADTEVHRATYPALSPEERAHPVLSAEHALSRRHEDGWAETMYRKTCWDATQNRYVCPDKGDYMNPPSHKVVVSVEGIADPSVDLHLADGAARRSAPARQSRCSSRARRSSASTCPIRRA